MSGNGTAIALIAYCLDRISLYVDFVTGCCKYPITIIIISFDHIAVTHEITF